MKDLLVKSDKITAVLDFDRITGAVLDKFITHSVQGELIVSVLLKKAWAEQLGVTHRTISNKLHHMEKVGVISQVDGNKYRLTGVELVNGKKSTKFSFFGRK